LVIREGEGGRRFPSHEEGKKEEKEEMSFILTCRGGRGKRGCNERLREGEGK